MESNVPKIRERALILPDRQCNLTTKSSQLASTVHNTELQTLKLNFVDYRWHGCRGYCR